MRTPHPALPALLALAGALLSPQAVLARPADHQLARIARANPGVDLVVAAVGNPPATLRANETFTTTVKVANRGNAKARRSVVRFYLAAAARQRVDGLAVAKPLRARKRAGSTARLTVPGTMSAGEYRFVACADDLKKVRERNERNNCRTAKKPTRIGAPGSAPVVAPAGSSAAPASPPGGDLPAPPPGEEPPPGNPPEKPDPGAVPSLADSVEFLYTGEDAVQQGVEPGTISTERVAVLRGRVLDMDGGGLAGVRLTVLDHGEYGRTWTGDDGRFDMVVNGAQLDVVFEKDGYLPVQKQIDAPWQDYLAVDDVVMYPLDADATQVELNSATPLQVVQGSKDGPEGAEPATLLFPGGLQATLEMPDGSTTPLSDAITVRATEVPGGSSQSLPGTMPGNVGLTYAVEFTVDEAVAAGARSVNFSKPVVNYTENFIGAPIGSSAPTAYYDRTDGRWVPSPNGRVLKITAIVDGKAEIDADETPGADSHESLAALGITGDERATLADLYEAGTELWRVPVMHFTPWDHNWPYGPPPGAQPPKLKEFVWKDPNDPCNKQGSIIACESQNLGEEIAIAGTGFDLRYDSSRQPGYHVAEQLEVPVTGGSLPPDLKGIEVTVDVAGRHFEKRWCDPSFPTTGESTCEGFDPITPNLTYELDWDHKDAYGRIVQGSPEATVKQTYVYEFNYYPTQDDFDNAFGGYPDGVEFFNGAVYCGSANPTVTGERGRLMHFFCGVLMVEKIQRPLGAWDVRKVDGLGGLTLSAHHGYDPNDKTVHLGDGRVIRSDPLGATTRTLAGGGNASALVPTTPTDAKSVTVDYLSDIATGPDGSLYGHSGLNQNRIWRVTPDGKIATIGGKISTVLAEYRGNPSGDEGPAIGAVLGNAGSKLDVGQDGTVYFTATGAGPGGNIIGYIRSITPDGIIHTIAGRPWNHIVGGEAYIPAGANGDGGPATSAAITDPLGIAVGPDGSVYFSERAGHPNNNRALVRRISVDGTVSKVAGGGIDKLPDGVTNAPFTDSEDLGTGEPATDQALGTPYGVAPAPDGSVYITDPTARVVQRVGTDGMITRVVGDHSTPIGYGMVGAAAAIGAPTDVAIAPDGGLVVRTNEAGTNGSETKLVRVNDERRVSPLAGAITNPGTCGACLSPDGEAANSTRIEANSVGVEVLPDGRTVYADGRHQARIVEPALPGHGGDTLVVPSTDGSEVYVFSSVGRHLKTLDGLTGATLLTFDYDADKRLVAATDASGNKTLIEREADGDPKAIVAPGGQRTELGLDGAGRVKTVTDPGGHATELTYDGEGMLTAFAEPGRPAATMVYDPDGRLIRDESPTGAVQTLARTETATRTEVKVTSGEGRVTTYANEALPNGDRRRSIERPTGAVTELLTKPDGSQVLTDPDGTVTTVTMTVDPRWGNRAPLVMARSIKTPSGKTQTMTQQRSVQLSDPKNPFTLTSMTTSVTLDDGAGGAAPNTTQSTYTAATKTIEKRDGAGHLTTAKLDSLGRVVELDPDGWLDTLDPIKSTFDAKGLISKITQGAQSWSFGYDSRNRLVSRTDAANRTLTFGYDDADRVVERGFPGGRTYKYAYAADGALESITMPNGKQHAFGADNRGELTAYAPPGSPGYQRELDKDGALTLLTAPSGAARETTLRGDGLEELTTYGPETDEMQYGVEGDERPSTATRTPDGGTAQSMAMTYDGVLPKTTGFSGSADGSFAYAFNGLLQLTGVTLTSGDDTASIAYAYDRDGRPTAAGPFTFTRNAPGGRVSSITDGTLTATYTYDRAGRMTKRELKTAGVVRYAVQLTYGSSGQITKRVETVGDQTRTLDYERNAVGEVTKVSQGGASLETYAYDANGNRTLRGRQGAPDETATFDDQDRITKQGATNYGVDADGFLASRGGDSFDYSIAGDLLAATASGQSVTYAYDVLGRRVARTHAGDTEQYLYGDPADPFRVSALRGPGGALSTLYYDDEGSLLAFERGGTRYYVGADQVGSPRVVFTADGTVVKQIDYDAFGGATDQTPGFWLPIGFAGGLADPVTGLVRFGLRDYDPAAGRFAAKDPSFFEGSPGNLYAYAGSDPVTLRDPSGLFCIGGTFYSGIGGGGQFCRKDGKNSVCVEGGVGAGGGLAVEPFGDAKSSGTIMQAEVTAKWGPLSAGVGAEMDLDCFTTVGYVKGGLAFGGLSGKIDTNGKTSWQSGGKSKSSFDGSGPRKEDGSWGTKVEGKLSMRKCWAF